MSTLGVGYSDHLSVYALIRMHNEAVLSKIGNEKVEHLEHVLFAVKEACSRAKTDPKIDTEEYELLEKLLMQVTKDLSEARVHAKEMMPEDDQSSQEP